MMPTPGVWRPSSRSALRHSSMMSRPPSFTSTKESRSTRGSGRHSRLACAIISYLLIAHADSILEKPVWLASFEESGRRIIIDDGEGEHSMSVFRREIAAGDSVALGRNSFDGTAAAPMYLAMLGSVTAVSAPTVVIPGDIELRQNLPNPIRNSTTISFSLPTPDEVSLKVFDVMGRELATIARGLYQSGDHRIQWSADGLAGGVYLVRLDASSTSRSIRVVVLR